MAESATRPAAASHNLSRLTAALQRNEELTRELEGIVQVGPATAAAWRSLHTMVDGGKRVAGAIQRGRREDRPCSRAFRFAVALYFALVARPLCARRLVGGWQGTAWGE